MTAETLEIWKAETGTADGAMDLDEDILRSSTEDLVNRTRLLENDIKANSSSPSVIYP